MTRVNEEQRLFVIPCGEGFTCLGFDQCHSYATRYAEWLGVEVPSAESKGTLESYARYEALVDLVCERVQRTKVQCPVDLVPQLIGLEGCRVEVLDCYGERRRFQVGKSTGWIPCHLELANSRSSGGGAVYGAPFQEVTIIRRARR